MRTTLAACGLAAVFLAPPLVPTAQERSTPLDAARLAGTWDLDTAGPPNPTERRVITVSAESMRVEILRAEDARPPHLTYRFDGKDTESAFGAGKAIARLVGERGTVVTETVYEISNSPITIREAFTVNPSGGELTVNTTVRVEHGYQGPLPAGASKSPNVSTAVSVFRKQR
jgi:hypothetical protein